MSHSLSNLLLAPDHGNFSVDDAPPFITLVGGISLALLGACATTISLPTIGLGAGISLLGSIWGQLNYRNRQAAQFGSMVTVATLVATVLVPALAFAVMPRNLPSAESAFHQRFLAVVAACIFMFGMWTTSHYEPTTIMSEISETVRAIGGTFTYTLVCMGFSCISAAVLLQQLLQLLPVQGNWLQRISSPTGPAVQTVGAQSPAVTVDSPETADNTLNLSSPSSSVSAHL